MPCDELITRPRCPTVCDIIMNLKNQRPGSKGTVEAVKKKVTDIHNRDNYTMRSNATSLVLTSRLNKEN
jgi:hypothetical protein